MNEYLILHECVLHPSQEFSLSEISSLSDIWRKNLTKNLTQIITKKFQAKPHRRKGEICFLDPAMSVHTSKKSIDDTFSKMCHKKQAGRMLPRGE